MKSNLFVSVLLVSAGFFVSPLRADDTLARFKGGIGVHPVSNVAGTPVGTNFPDVTRNVVRGINPAGQLWVIQDLEARVSWRRASHAAVQQHQDGIKDNDGNDQEKAANEKFS